jgi:hypothetical protein
MRVATVRGQFTVVECIFHPSLLQGVSATTALEDPLFASAYLFCTALWILPPPAGHNQRPAAIRRGRGGEAVVLLQVAARHPEAVLDAVQGDAE